MSAAVSYPMYSSDKSLAEQSKVLSIVEFNGNFYMHFEPLSTSKGIIQLIGVIHNVFYSDNGKTIIRAKHRYSVEPISKNGWFQNEAAGQSFFRKQSLQHLDGLACKFFV